MRIGDPTLPELLRRARGPGLIWRVGPFLVRLRSRSASFLSLFQTLYADHGLCEPDCGEVVEFHIELRQDRFLRRWWHPRVYFDLDGPTELLPFPLDHAFPLFEWGFNFGIASRANRYLMLHAGVVARGDRALILPALPGSGKSTLSAALVARGWRLLSDEFGLVEPERGNLQPLPRPIALKNESIEVMRAFAPHAVIGPVFPKTRKGSVAHMKPPAESVRDGERLACPAWVVTPKFRRGAGLSLDPMGADHGFMRLAGHSFNYEMMGERGFRLVTAMTRRCRFFELTFGDLEEAVACLDRLAGGK
ncbi:MAG: HprK-related kinase A [Magnetococcales bacterium]|nr:HprK-related kinase A [Magnetococcales bacterium]